MKTDWTVIIYRDGLQDEIIINAVYVRQLDNSSILVDDTQITFNHSFVLSVKQGVYL